jgi:hypothetical protein
MHQRVWQPDYFNTGQNNELFKDYPYRVRTYYNTCITTNSYTILKFNVTNYKTSDMCDVTQKHVGSFIEFVTLYFNIVYELVVIYLL